MKCYHLAKNRFPLEVIFEAKNRVAANNLFVQRAFSFKKFKFDILLHSKLVFFKSIVNQQVTCWVQKKPSTLITQTTLD